MKGDFATSGGYPNGRSECNSDLAIGLRTDPEIAEIGEISASARFGAMFWAKVGTKG